MKNPFKRSKNTSLVLAAAALGAVTTAAWVEIKARRAEREHPAMGRTIQIDGVQLHYVERGEGPTVVLLHGNAVTLNDFEASGLLQDLAAEHRVIAFDRPGFGHSSRPRDRFWTPSAQADLIAKALHKLHAEPALVVGHSMGTMVATALALNHPKQVRALVLMGGYYYPSARVDALLVLPVALPVVGDVLRYTATPLAARAMLGKMVKAMFSPRPVQLRADAEDGTLMVPGAMSIHERYGELAALPVLLIAGADDRVVSPDGQSGRLHKELPHSELVTVPETGHMVHYETEARRRVVEAAKTMALQPEGKPVPALAA